MDALRELLDDLKQHEAARSSFLGLLHILIGRRISRSDGALIPTGMTRREVAALPKRLRWDREAAAQVIVAAGPPNSFQPTTCPFSICMGAPIQLPILAPTSKPTATAVMSSRCSTSSGWLTSRAPTPISSRAGCGSAWRSAGR